MSQSTIKSRRTELKKELSSYTVGLHNIDHVIRQITKTKVNPEFIVVDLFCGAGGTSTGFHMTNGIAKVIACVNHDHLAIKSHWVNHPEVAHFEEDIRTLDLNPLTQLVAFYKNLYPSAKLILWASLECTNFSKAKGGQPRDADSRTLADHLDRYIHAIDPDYVQIENVVEFMSWGPMMSITEKTDEGFVCCSISFTAIYDRETDDDLGPMWKRVKGLMIDLNKGEERIVGYRCSWKGKPVSTRSGSEWIRWRNRLCSYGYRDEWKELNSANFGAYTSRNRLFGCFAKHGLPIAWPAATHAKSAKSGDLYEAPLLSWKPVKDVLDFTDEGSSIFNRKKELCIKTYEVIANGLIKSIKEGEDSFLFKYYGNGDNINSINSPAGTLTTKDRFALILRQYKTGFTSSINVPIGALPTNPKANLVSFIMNKSHGGHTTSINKPCPVIVASQNKSPLYIIQVLMNEYGIEDITMRMLKVPELLKIQGFPNDYVLEGNQSDQKKFIGNSVVPIVVKAWAEAMAEAMAA